jgi:hypothetical protein
MRWSEEERCTPRCTLENMFQLAQADLDTRREDYTKGVLDLRAALRLDDQHRNARKYLETTLMRRGKHREQRGKVSQGAEKCYCKPSETCCNVLVCGCCGGLRSRCRVAGRAPT